MVQEIRKINIFPIWYFNEEGIYDEINKVINTPVCFEEDGSLKVYYFHGLLLLDFLFPNIHKIYHYDSKKI